MCSFFIREISNKPAMIYLVVGDSGKQYKISTGRKILYSQWNRRKQEPIINSSFSNDVNRSALVTCHVLNKLKSEYQNYIYYLCSNNEKFNINILRAKINSKLREQRNVEQNINFEITKKDMVKGNIGKTPAATKALDKALKKYIADSQVKESTGKAYELLVGKYKRWIVDVYKVDAMSALKQASFDKYAVYLKKGGASSHEINKLVLIKKLINNYIAIGNKYGIGQIIFNPLKDKRLSDDRVKVELLDDEIERIENAELPKKLNLWRDIFCLAIYTGQRVSDIQQIVVGGYSKKGDFLVIKTIKRGKAAYIPYTEKVRHYLSNVEGKVKLMSDANFRNKLNTKTKEIFKIAGLFREISYTDAHHTKHTDKLCNIISSHFARHTFTTKKVREGYSFEEVGKMIGDTGQIVELTYSHLTADDHIKTLKDKARKLKVEAKEINEVAPEVSTSNQESSLSKGTMNFDDIIDTLKDMQGGNISEAVEYVRKNKVKVIKLIEYYTGKTKGMILDDDAFTGYLMMLWDKLKY